MCDEYLIETKVVALSSLGKSSVSPQVSIVEINFWEMKTKNNCKSHCIFSRSHCKYHKSPLECPVQWINGLVAAFGNVENLSRRRRKQQLHLKVAALNLRAVNLWEVKVVLKVLCPRQSCLKCYISKFASRIWLRPKIVVHLLNFSGSFYPNFEAKADLGKSLMSLY